MNDIESSGYLELLADIKQRIRSAQYEALKAVNKELIALYWDIGKSIVEKQQQTGWGKSVVEKLAGDLQAISWVKNVVMMSKCKDAHELQFYITATKKFGWSKNVLIHQIENKSYEKYLLNQTNFEVRK